MKQFLLLLAFSLTLCIVSFSQDTPNTPVKVEAPATAATNNDAAVTAVPLKETIEALNAKLDKLQTTIQDEPEELTGFQKLLKWIGDYWGIAIIILLGLGETLVKAFPTEKNLARFEWLMKIIDFITSIFGNQDKDGNQHITAKPST